MIGWKKEPGVLYLAWFLFAVCGAAAALTGTVKILTAGPVAKAEANAVREGLAAVFDGVDYDNDPVSDSIRLEDGTVIYPARKGGRPAAYAAEAHGAGYGGEIIGLIAFNPDGAIRRYVITKHSETPGIGSRVTDRVRVRTAADLVRGRTSGMTLPPNAVLDSFEGLRADGGKWTKGTVHFMTGATISSAAVTDLAWKAACLLKEQIGKEH